MRDETLAELLRSPLDDDSGPRGRRGWLTPFAIAAVVGVVAAMAWLAARSGEDSAEVSTTSSTPPAAAAGEAFPAGFVRVSDHAAMRPAALYAQGDRTVIALTTVAEAGTPPEAAAVFPGGMWQLRDVEGRTTDTFEEVRNPEALGTVAVRFLGGAGGAPRALVLTPLTEPEVVTASIPLDLPRFPFRTGRSFEVPLASDLALGGLLTRLDEDGGDLRWDLRGADALARVDIVVTLPETAGEGDTATTMLSEHIAPPYPFQRQRLPRPAPAEFASDVLRRAGPAIDDPTVVTRAVVDVTVSLYRTRDDAVVEFDLTGLAP